MKEFYRLSACNPATAKSLIRLMLVLLMTASLPAFSQPTCPCTIWSPSDVPGIISQSDVNPYELGVRFRSYVDGYITGIRFYKSAENTGTHIGNLWSTAGVNLAQATFSNETTSGWQEVAFSSPVAITAGTTYVASYHTSVGHYSADNNYFATSGHVSYYLEALQSGIDGLNGVYTLSTSTVYPTSSYMATNYWVDVVFALEAVDNTPPAVVSVTPLANATAVATTIHPTAIFNEALDPSTVTTSSVLMTGPGATPVSGTVICTWGSVTFTPSSSLDYSTTYTMTLEGSDGDYPIADIAGNELSSSYVWSFTTSEPPPPPPTEGPGGPILVISAASNPFSRYPVEILRAEGFNEFFAMDISEVTPATLNAYDVIILGEFSLTDQFVTDLTSWVTAGGTLITMRPDNKLSNLLGITRIAGTLSDGYLLVNTATGPGIGIVNQTIQFHGTADLYTLNGAAGLATLYSDATTAMVNPAVTQILVGGNGGKAVAFTYDLARSVVYTHQGNPAWAGQKRDGAINPIRSDDMFYPDWINLDKVAIPQADEQQRLLANIIVQGALHRKPLPRFWFLPKGLKAAIVMTGDDHGDAGMQPRFDADIAMSPFGCSVNDWECIRSTGYLYVGGTFTNEQAVAYNNMGFETALHINTECLDYDANQFQGFITAQMTDFTNKYTGIPAPSTNRNHCIAWSGWSTTAEVSAANGIRLDVNYYYWPNYWHLNRPGMFTGSGNPMRFAKLDGTIIDCYQVVTQMQDEGQYVPATPYPAFCDALLDKAIGPEGYYGVFCANMHFDNPDHPGANAITSSAQAHGIPVVSSKQMLDWLDGRNGSSFGNITWNSNTLSFSVTVGAVARNLRGMLPEHSENGELLTLTNGGSSVAFITEIIKGISYAFFPATAGDYIAIYGVDNIAPVISNVVATPHTDGTATVTWTTNEASNSRVDFGLVSGTLTSNVSDASMVTSHSITLSSLSPTSTYYYRVTSVDNASNSASMPVPPAENSFTTPAGICAQDQTQADFSLGTPDANTLVVLEGDGAVILKPGFIEEFSGSTLPSGWVEDLFSGGTSATYSGGQIIVDGSHISSNTTFVPATSLEFAATFTAGNFQNVGFSSNRAFDAPWVVIGRGTLADNNLYARAYNGSETNILLGSNLLGSPHNFKIKWNSGNFEFYVDGASTPAATITINVITNMVIQVSDVEPGAVLSVDWVRATPYLAPGIFTSRVFDGGSQKIWGEATWTADIPETTSLSLSARSGNTPAPDGSWTAFTQIPGSGSTIGMTSQYIQYRADLSTGNTLFTPVLKDISISCAEVALSAPVITVQPVSQTSCAGGNVSFTSGASGVPAPLIQWQVKTNVTDWTNIDGATNSPLSFVASTPDNGNQYRAVWTNSQSPDAISNPATLTVNAALTAAIGAVTTNLCQGENIQLQLSSATGQAPYSLVVNGINYTASNVGEVFATLDMQEYSIWGTGVTPLQPTVTDNQPLEVGFKFRSSVAGFIKGIRFYNGADNNGTYTGNLWNTGGTLLASAVFTNVTTNGWQEVRFSNPVSIAANTTYIASYYSSSGYFAMTTQGLASVVVNGPLSALAAGTDGSNGVFRYGAGGGFPNAGNNTTNSNYFADVVFSEAGNDLTYNLTSVTDNNGCNITGAPLSSVTVTVNPLPSGTITPLQATVYEGEDYNLVFNATAGTGPFTLVVNGTSYPGVASGMPFSAGTASYSPVPVSIWTETDYGKQNVDDGSYELGLSFRSDVSGTISAIRFYKTDTQVLAFTVTLWDQENSIALATANYTSDNTEGWKQINFSSPVPINANTDYIASYFSPGAYFYAFTGAYSFPKVTLPLRASGSSYRSGSGYPGTPSTANYWVDVAFNDGSSGVSGFNLTSVTSDAGCILTGNPISSAAITVNQARVWTGSTGIDWNTPSNWSTGVVPVADNVVVPVVSTNYPVISGPVTTNALIVRPSASLTIDGGGTLTVNGNLNTTDGTLTINSASTTSSGSLIVNGTSSGTVTYNRIMPGSAWHYVSSPVSLTASPEGSFYAWNEEAGDWDAGITAVPVNGRGYTLQTNGNSVSFTGTLVPTVSITATSPYYTDYTDGTLSDYNSRWANGRTDYGGGGWNLLGNPFTSAMSIADFLEINDGTVTDPANKFDPNYVAVYIYDGYRYYYRGKATGFIDPVQYETPENLLFGFENIQAGQGFFVLAMKNNVTFTFDKSMQTHGPATIMLKSAGSEDESWPGLRLKVKYGDKQSSALVIYNDDMNAGLDPGYDVGLLSSSPDVDVYTSLVAGGNSVNFAQQALPVTGCEQNVIPVGIDTEKGGQVTFSAFTVPLGDNKFWLEDRRTGVFTNLNSNTYTVTLPEKTYGAGRFYIIASINTPTGIDSPLEDDIQNLRIWAYDGKVIIKGDVSEGSLCEIYDTGGKKVLTISLTDGELNTVTMPSVSKGFFLVRVIDEGKVTMGKVVIL